MLQVKDGMNQPLEKKEQAERGANQLKAQPEEGGFSSVSHSRYYSLIQDQARELTHLRQKMRIGRVVSSLLIQHVNDAVKIFEELLSSNNIDHSMEQHFREQLVKGSQLAESLASKFSTDDYTNKNQAGRALQTLSILRKMHKKDKVTEVLETKQDDRSQMQPQIHSSSTSSLFAEQGVHPAVDVANVSPATPVDSVTLPSNYSGARPNQQFYLLKGTTPHHTTQLSRTPEPGHHGSSGPWDEMRPQKMNVSGNLSSFSSLHRPDSKPSGSDLLEKHLVEIQNLRQRLEESVCFNDHLQERLEHVLSNADQGKSTTQSVPDVCLATLHSYTKSHSSGSGQDFL
ncbi:myomegalin [Choloepus didactylus]|uniref:myomegalin n=1 Tax=Choloepus didactylus TaxID=27675 RepID=UPI0018A096E9|nr:myomegalin [Choloepus didactylus]